MDDHREKACTICRSLIHHTDNCRYEIIVSAAIKYEGTVYTVPRPGRHHDVIRLMFENHGLGPDTMRAQGFVTSSGRFVDRNEACAIAMNANQILNKTLPVHLLFSEDVW